MIVAYNKLGSPHTPMSLDLRLDGVVLSEPMGQNEVV